MGAEQTTDPEVERAFREWCAMVGVPSGSFRLRRDEEGRFFIEQVDGVRVVAPPMSGRALCDAVRFLHESFAIKTVQVARAVARKRARRA